MGPDAKDGRGWTPLRWASANRYEAIVQLLLEAKVDVDSRDNGGQTSLSWAAYRGHAAIIKLLLEHGADADSKDTKYGGTPLPRAAPKYEHKKG